MGKKKPPKKDDFERCCQCDEEAVGSVEGSPYCGRHFPPDPWAGR